MTEFDPQQAARAHRRGCPKNFTALRNLIRADLYRYAGSTGVKAFARHFLFTPGFKYSATMRTCGYLKTLPARGFGLYLVGKAYLLHLRYKYGIAIPEYTRIGPGLMINRFSGVFINGGVEIGSNVNITHGTVLGQLNRGPRAGNPVIGDRVFFGSGAKVIGRIFVGDDASIGANAVVTRDVPAQGVAGGVPAKILSDAGSQGYINRQVPEWLMRKCADCFVDD
ncbi:serine O-acetyltransferase [Stakelama saccharophila]|uniref:Hexapeptide transferase n=1 Tax=Stakelama saccharophila TaxID=3075605 RepID=A0ABZ0BCV5_9SPHN|nr:hexapeptide transferase [Stakelama sp. W311]WNO54521.1 hexapeptide transferase [Stakelama sp. W311]